MSTKKSKSRSHEPSDQIIQIKSKDLKLTRESRSTRCGCCGKRYISLPIVGFALIAVGALLIMAYFSIRKITSSVTLTQNTFPSFVTGGMMAANGLMNMILCKRRPKGLIIISIICTLTASLLCFAGAIHSLTNVAPLLSSFDRCLYFPKETSCRCFFASDLRLVSYIFRGTENCRVVQFDLRNMVYGVSGVYGAGLAVCFIAGVLECILLCPTRRSKRLSYRSRSEGDGKCTSTSCQSQTSQTNLTLTSSEEELIAGASSTSEESTTTTNTQTRLESQPRHEAQSACVRQHTCSRRDYCINYNSASTRHDPPPPYTE